MKKITIIYGSTTGNTEIVANMIKDNLKGDVTVTEVTKANDELVKNADLVLYGSSTWGYGELQDDFMDYIDNMSKDLLANKDVAIFGCGDQDGFPDVFCEATEIIKAKALECKANIVCENLKVDGDPADNEKQIIDFAKRF